MGKARCTLVYFLSYVEDIEVCRYSSDSQEVIREFFHSILCIAERKSRDSAVISDSSKLENREITTGELSEECIDCCSLYGVRNKIEYVISLSKHLANFEGVFESRLAFRSEAFEGDENLRIASTLQAFARHWWMRAF